VAKVTALAFRKAAPDAEGSMVVKRPVQAPCLNRARPAQSPGLVYRLQRRARGAFGEEQIWVGVTAGGTQPPVREFTAIPHGSVTYLSVSCVHAVVSTG
jgi:hypothetical protein